MFMFPVLHPSNRELTWNDSPLCFAMVLGRFFLGRPAGLENVGSASLGVVAGVTYRKRVISHTQSPFQLPCLPRSAGGCWVLFLV